MPLKFLTTALLGLCLMLAACAGLAGEPRIIATIPSAATATQTQETGYPLTPPDLALGARIFAQRCVMCHGTGGRGDGEMVLDGRVGNPGDFTDRQTVSAQSPETWYQTITNGRIEKLMPPWRDALSEAERWAVAMYTYTLSYTSEQLALGGATWAENCADCHGERGRGDGPKAGEISRPVGDLTQQSEMVTLSDEALYNIVSEGVGEMPAFADTLDETTRRAVAMYTRRLSLANLADIGETLPTATAEVGPASSTGTITGQIINGSSTGAVPNGMAVRLIIETAIRLETRDTVADASGSFTFNDVPFALQNRYLAITLYRDRRFFSKIAIVDPAQNSLTLPIAIYELTEDPSVVKLSAVDVRALPVQLPEVGSGLQITQTFVYTNTSDRAFTTSRRVREQAYASLLVLLPPGSVVLAINDPDRYALVQDQFALIDTAPVLPGDNNIVQLVYFLPYEDGAIVEQPINNAFEGMFTLKIAPTSLAVSGAQLTRTGEETIEGRAFAVYSGTLSQSAGDVLRYELSGRAIAARPVEIASESLLPLLLLVLGFGFLLAAGVIYSSGRRRPATEGDKNRVIDGLVRQIAELDAAHEAGQINHDLYQRQRKQLKAQVAALIEEDDRKNEQ